jgi:hypothetical protein
MLPDGRSRPNVTWQPASQVADPRLNTPLKVSQKHYQTQPRKRLSALTAAAVTVLVVVAAIGLFLRSKHADEATRPDESTTTT